MLQATLVDRTRFQTEPPAPTNLLLQTLLNRLVLDNIIPYLPVHSLLNLASTNREFRSLVYESPGVFRHLDLTRVKTAQFDVDNIDHGGQVWRNVQLDENLTEDDFYSGPLRGIFATLRRRDLLQDVQTLVLDGLSVTAELCNDIINDPTYSVRLLSIRDIKNLNHGKLRGSLQYACRRSRPEGTPRLKALYVFGSRDALPAPAPAADKSSISAEWNQKSRRALSSSLGHEGDLWWSKKGRMISKHVPEEWANCLLVCEDIIAFDALLCQGPRHRNSSAFGKVSLVADSAPAVATFALPPCDGCGKCPEQMITPGAGHSPTRLPLLSPPPILSSSVWAATTPRQPAEAFVPRCLECLRERYCGGCHKWWCESCYLLPRQQGHHDPAGTSHELSLEFSDVKVKPRISKSCWECGQNCDACIDRTQRVCRKCCGGYCIVHNEGSTSTFCDWCVSRGRGLGRL